MKTLFVTDDVDLYERLRRNVAPNGDFMVCCPYTNLCGVGFDRVVVDVSPHYVKYNFDRFAAWMTDVIWPRLLQHGAVSMPRDLRGWARSLGMPEV